MANKNKRRYSVSCVMGKLLTRTRCHYRYRECPKSKNTDNTECWQDYSDSHKLNPPLACDSKIVFFIVYSKNLKAIAHEGICTQVFTAALIIAWTWKLSRCPLVDGSKSTLGCSHTKKCSNFRGNELSSDERIWRSLYM